MKGSEKLSAAAETLFNGLSEDALAKLFVGVSVLLGQPWLIAAEPILSRAFARLNNKKGKDAVLAIAKEVEADEARRKFVAEMGGQVDDALARILGHIGRQQEEAHQAVLEAVESSAANLLANFGINLHRLEERLRSELSAYAPRSDVLRALEPRIQTLEKRPKPSSLLVAANQAVPFVGRESTLQELDEWVTSDRPAALALVVGRGGAGKTRLAMQACARCRAAGMPAGFLVNESDATLDALCSGEGKRLVVIDYAEGRTALLERLLKRLTNPTVPVRVLLLARQDGGWWDGLARIPETDDRLVGQALCISLDRRAVALSTDDRQVIWQSAVATFGRWLESGTPAQPPDYTNDTFARPLPLLMHALVSLSGPAPSSEPKLLEQVLVHEERHHGSALNELSTNKLERRALAQALTELLAITTLLGGLPVQVTLEPFLTSRLQTSFGDRVGLYSKGLLRVAHDLYPLGDDGIAHLEPDLLGEQVVQQALKAAPKLLDETVRMASSEVQRKCLLTVLARLARRVKDPRHFEQLFSTHLEALALDALDVAAESADPHDIVSATLAAQLKQRGAQAAELCLGIANKCPVKSLALAQVAFEATATALDAARERAKDGTEKNLAEHARLASKFAIALSEVGQRDQALSAAQEAVSIRRKLAKSRPDVYLPDLVSSLNNLAMALSGVGVCEAALGFAQEAVDIRRKLAESRPDVYLPNLARSLDTLGRVHESTGAAASAVAAYKQGAEYAARALKSNPRGVAPVLVMLLRSYRSACSAAGVAMDSEWSKLLAAIEASGTA